MQRDGGAFGSASPELRKLVSAVCDQTITAQQRDRLEQLLALSEGARKYFLAHLEMWGQMQFLFQTGMETEAVCPFIFESH